MKQHEVLMEPYEPSMQWRLRQEVAQDAFMRYAFESEDVIGNGLWYDRDDTWSTIVLIKGKGATSFTVTFFYKSCIIKSVKAEHYDGKLAEVRCQGSQTNRNVHDRISMGFDTRVR